MCGICGWIQLRSKTDIESSALQFENMTRVLFHRGPDDRGGIIFDNAVIGMTRLGIIDLSGGHQPIANETEDCWVVCNGEIYNFIDLRGELQGRGHRFRTRSDAEVVVHAYEEWGKDCVRHLRGMFAFAIYDRRPSARDPGARPVSDHRLFLARDRVGKKPLYYYQDGDLLIFGSEIKAILAHPSVTARVNRSAIPLYLAYGYVPAPSTLFEDIHELSPGHTLILAEGKAAVNQYWEVPLHAADDQFHTEQHYIEGVRELFAETVRIRLTSEVPLGAFLSGGLDSAAVVGVMTRLTKQPVMTFAMGFAGDPSYNELKHARQVANHFHTDHHEFVVEPDAIRLLPNLVWHYDQPFADSSAIPAFLISQCARENVTVVLTGEGGDELFAGYDRFVAAMMAEAYRNTPRFVHKTLLQFLRHCPESTSYRGFVRRARRFLESAPLPLVERYFDWVGIFRDGFIRDLLAESTDVQPVGHFRAYFDHRQERDVLGQLLVVNMKSYLPGDLLVKTDRMTMANSLEARCPFLDQQLLEFACKIPSKLKLRGLTTKYVLKRALEDLVPQAIIRRKKHGFGVPVGQWFRSSLKQYVREVLLSPESLRRGYFNETSLRLLLDEHQSGRRDHGHRLWALLTFEIWHRLFIDQKVRPWLSTAPPTRLRFFESSAGLTSADRRFTSSTSPPVWTVAASSSGSWSEPKTRTKARC